MEEINLSKPAAQLTKKEYACILLKLPMTGDKDLNKLIMLSQKRDIATQVLNAVMAKTFDDQDENKEDTVLDVLEYMEAMIDGLHKHSKTFRKNPDNNEGFNR